MKKSQARLDAIASGFITYIPELPCARGHLLRKINGTCVECRRLCEKARYYAKPEQTKLRVKEKYQRNAEILKTRRRTAYATNPEPEKAIARVRSAEWRKTNPNHAGVKAAKQTWKLNNIGKVRADVVKRRVSKIQRTPPWLDIVQNAEIEFTYKYCAALRSIGLNYHVDHIVPLQGKTVSGLHVPWNLQVIPANENIRKANRFNA
jgi:hypothetical protein